MSRDDRISRAAVTETDRMRVVAQLKAQAANGQLSSRQLEDATELTFRAKTRADLDAVIDGLDGSAHVRAEMIATYGLSAPSSQKRRMSQLQRQVVTSGGFLAVWLVVCAATQSSAIWYVVTILGSMGGLLFRITRSRRREALGRAPARQRWVG